MRMVEGRMKRFILQPEYNMRDMERRMYLSVLLQYNLATPAGVHELFNEFLISLVLIFTLNCDWDEFLCNKSPYTERPEGFPARPC